MCMAGIAESGSEFGTSFLHSRISKFTSSGLIPSPLISLNNEFENIFENRCRTPRVAGDGGEKHLSSAQPRRRPPARSLC